mmetsp:Transcript_46836/g.106223  ORF Transcript_46836/g.106223 Transcript_46836/m.106223 type:complete len:222 (-) Transcript_46836:170-835(-)
MKFAASDDVPVPLSRFLPFLSSGSVSWEDCAELECTVLMTLEFQHFSAPTWFEWIQLYAAPLMKLENVDWSGLESRVQRSLNRTAPRDRPEQCKALVLAEFLAETTMFSVHLLHRASAPVLAAACLVVALAELEAPPVVMEAFRQGMRVSAGLLWGDVDMMTVAQEVLQTFQAVRHHRDLAEHLQAKYDRGSRFNVWTWEIRQNIRDPAYQCDMIGADPAA